MRNWLISGLLGLIAGLWLTGCEATRHLDAGQLLVERTPVFKGDSALLTEDLLTAVRTRPNKRILYSRPYLLLYNAGKSIQKDTSRLKRLYRRIDPSTYYERSLTEWLLTVAGEKPSIVDLKQVAADCRNLESLYFGRGYFNAQVRYEITPSPFAAKQARVIFHIKENQPWRINEISWNTRDSSALRLIESQQKKSRLLSGALYREEDVTAERARINELLRDNGYYQFNARWLIFEVDTSVSLPEVVPNLLDSIQKPCSWVNIRIILPDSLEAYVISGVRIRLRYFLEDELDAIFDASTLTDSLRRELRLSKRRFSADNPLQIQSRREYLRTVNLNTISRTILIRKNQPFSVRNTRETQRTLQELGVFRNSLINYIVDENSRTLLCEIDLNVAKRFDYRIGVESFQTEHFTPSANMPGVGLNLQFGMKNAFRRGERLRFSGNTNLNFYNPDDSTGLQIYSQIGGNARLDVPRFLTVDFIASLLKKRQLLKYVSPNTSFSLNYNRQRPLEYLRNSLTMRLRYEWFHSDNHVTVDDRQVRSEFTPIDLTIVNSELDPAFRQRILGEDALLAEFLLIDFRQRVTLFSSYYRSISDRYSLLRHRSTTLFRYGVEIGGNLPFLIDRFGNKLGLKDEDYRDQELVLGPYTYGYGQFLRASLEAKWFQPLGAKTELVARGMIGAARGWNFTLLTPFENRFFSGGTNSVRGWQSNTLGPGIFKVTSGSRIITLGGEYKLEANLELRRDLFSPFEIAVFVDAGNVWLSDRGSFIAEGGGLDLQNFQLGVAGGIGLRIDLTYFVMRLDLGQQLYAPDVQDWIVKRLPQDIGAPRLQYNLAIGYPF